MAENDIYNNEKKYNDFINNLNSLLKKPEAHDKRKYWILNKKNLLYFNKLDEKLRARDLSYIRRLRLFRTLLMICNHFKKDLKDVTEREEIDRLMEFSYQHNKSIKTKTDFAIDTKHIWKTLFPEKDYKGRVDDTVTPWIVKHISSTIDRSQTKLKGDKFSVEEFEKLIQGFSEDPRMQCLLSLSLESLGRPQEILGRKLKDVEVHDNYAKIYISEHGKEGTGLLKCIDSYYYLTKWLEQHPFKDDPERFLFINLGRVNQYDQLKPPAANKVIRQKLKELNIKKPITLYSLKRNGVTMRRLRGDSDLEIQHTARWTSTKQLHTYDLSSQEESLKIELIKRGKIKLSDKEKGKFKQYIPKTKECPYCKAENSYTSETCFRCKRLLDRDKIIQREAELEEKAERIEERARIIEEKLGLLMKKLNVYDKFMKSQTH